MGGFIVQKKTAKTSETGVSAGAGRALLRPNQSTMTNILLSGESIDKTKEADTFAFLITDVIIPEGMKRVDVADCGLSDRFRNLFQQRRRRIRQ